MICVIKSKLTNEFLYIAATRGRGRGGAGSSKGPGAGRGGGAWQGKYISIVIFTNDSFSQLTLF